MKRIGMRQIQIMNQRMKTQQQPTIHDTFGVMVVGLEWQ
jgi:hypothetical protein